MVDLTSLENSLQGVMINNQIDLEGRSLTNHLLGALISLQGFLQGWREEVLNGQQLEVHQEKTMTVVGGPDLSEQAML